MERLGKHHNQDGEKCNYDTIGPKNPEQRRELREVLQAFGFVLVAMTPTETHKDDANSNFASGYTTETREPQLANQEVLFEESVFEKYVAAEVLRVHLTRDQVMATDEHGNLIAGPITLGQHSGWGVLDMVARTEKNGGTPQGIPGSYLEEIRQKVRLEHDLPDGMALTIAHVYLSLLRSSDPDVTIASLANERLHSIPTGGTMTYAEMIETSFKPHFNDSEYGVLLAELLKESIPALITKESMFSPTAVSSAGARAELQILPETFARYAPAAADPTDFNVQLLVASRYFEASYRYLTQNLRSELDMIRVQYFNDDEESFTKNFMLPLLINGYNAGDGNMRKVVEWFIMNFYNPEFFSEQLAVESVLPQDVYHGMARLAFEQGANPHYGPQASNYSVSILATSSEIMLPKDSPYILASQ